MTKRIPEPIVDSNEEASDTVVLTLADKGDSFYYDEIWEATNLSNCAKHHLSRIEESITGASVIVEIFARDTCHRNDAGENEGIKYEPLNQYLMGGLQCALNVLMRGIKVDLERIRMREGGDV
jgi:chloramphenicol 3-O-phosphotransferase